MAKYLVTGCVSRQANPAKNKKDVMVSWLLAQALRDMGHEVEHRNATMLEDYDDFDHVFLGLAAMHSVGCNRSYGFLAAYLKNQGKVSFYIDDVEIGKVRNGIRVMANDPKKLVKPFYKYRLEYETAVQPEWHSWLMQGIDSLESYAWPTVIVPMFEWGDVTKYQSQLPNATEILPLDLSAYVPEYVGEDEWSSDPDRTWVTELHDRDRWFDTVRSVYPFHSYGKGYAKRPDDEALVNIYARSWGVIERGLDNGFFHSRLVYAAQARTLFVTRWQNVQALGEPFSLLADTAADLSLDERIAWANAQAQSLENWTWPTERVKDTLTTLVKEREAV